MKSLTLKILSIAAVVAVIISISIIPVSAGSNSYYDSGTVYVSDFIKQDGFALRDMHQWDPGAPYYDRNGYFEWNDSNTDYMLSFPELYTWSYYWLAIPTDTITLETGDVYYLDFYFVFKSSCPLWVDEFQCTDYVSGDGDLNYKFTVLPQPTASVDGWKSYGSLQKHSLHFQVEITSTGTVSFKGFTFYFQLYKSRTDPDYFNIYDTTTYRLYGGDPTSPNYPKYEDPRDSELAGVLNELEGLEDDLINGEGGINAGLDEVNRQFKAFSLLSFVDGLTGIIRIYNVIVPKNWFYSELVSISLSLGLFAFIVGTATLAVARFSKRNK